MSAGSNLEDAFSRNETYEETPDRVDEHEDHHFKNQASIQLLCCYSHQSDPDGQFHKSDGEQIDRLVDKIDEQPVLVIVGWYIAAMLAGSISGLHDRHCEAGD